MAKNNRVATTADRLKEAMATANKSQADLARETGLSKSTLSRYLSGEFEPKQNAIGKLAFALNVGEMWLWGYDVPADAEKKNDALADIVVKLRTDEELFKAVQSVCNLDREKLLSLSTFLKQF